tara:strand:+ start:421 stop:606 length:186 start_codon:yes stop_codon:yes gene_type:complete
VVVVEVLMEQQVQVELEVEELVRQHVLQVMVMQEELTLAVEVEEHNIVLLMDLEDMVVQVS